MQRSKILKPLFTSFRHKISEGYFEVLSKTSSEESAAGGRFVKFKYVIISIFAMDYLGRNRLVIAEIGQNLRLERGYEVRRGSGSIFTAVGHYRSKVLGNDVYVGLKERKKFRGDVLRFPTARDLSLLRAIEQKLPHLLQEFPLFYGLLVDSTGEEVGVICEDFSQGGKYEVNEVTRSWRIPVRDDEIPKELERLKGRKIDNHDLATMCFLVDGRRRIGDFVEVFSGLSISEMEEIFPTSDLSKQLRKYTLRVKYNIPPAAD